MNARSRYLFQPVYGYGWFCGTDAIDIDAPFEIEGESNERGAISGVVVGSHLFSKFDASLEPRHKERESKMFNITLTDTDSGKKITGYAELLKIQAGV